MAGLCLGGSKVCRVVMALLVPMAHCLPIRAADSGVFARIDGSAVPYSQIDATVTRLMRNAAIPGLGLALIQGGKVVYLKSYGVRNKEPEQPLTVNSVMTAASFTKVAFTYLVLQLVDHRALDLDKPVYEYLPRPLPDYPAYQDLARDMRYKLITARMLLDHTGGFANWRRFEEDHRLRIHFQPGMLYAYSGEGFVLLQLVVETITHEPLQELMQQRVFEPLGMTRTGMVWRDAFETDYANGYDESGRSLGPERRRVAEAAGSMQTTIADFSRFMLAIVSGHGLGKQTYAQMLSTQIPIVSKREFPTLPIIVTNEHKDIQLAYGLGWGLYRTPHGKAFFKEGHDDGWRNYTVCYQTQASCMVIMTNSSNGEGIYQALLQELLRDTWNPVEWEGFKPVGGH